MSSWKARHSDGVVLKTDLCFGGDHADLLRQEFEEMDREFDTPSSPIKHQHRGEASSDYSGPDPDSEGYCGL